MPAKLDIINAALARAGARGGNFSAAGSQGMQVADAAYARCRDYCLSLYPWPFALRLVKLARAAEAPACGARHAYPLPGDCVRVVEVTDVANPEKAPEYEVIGSALHSDAASVLLRYVSNSRDVPMSEAFADALEWRLAFEIAPYVAQGGSAARDFFQLFEQALDRAKVDADAQNNPGPAHRPSRFLRERWVN